MDYALALDYVSCWKYSSPLFIESDDVRKYVLVIKCSEQIVVNSLFKFIFFTHMIFAYKALCETINCTKMSTFTVIEHARPGHKRNSRPISRSRVHSIGLPQDHTKKYHTQECTPLLDIR